MRRCKWREVLPLVWQDQWEELLALLALVTSIWIGNLPLFLTIVYVGVSAALVRSIYRAVKHTCRTIQEKHIPIVVLAGKDSSVADGMWDDVLRHMSPEPWYFAWKQYEKDFRLNRSRLFLHEEDSLPFNNPEKWLSLSYRFRQRFDQITGEVSGRRVFHVFMNGPITMALGLGASLGTMFEVVVHQYFPGIGGSSYLPVADFYSLSRTNKRGMHYLEDAVTSEFQYVTIEGDPGTMGELYASIWMAKDDPKSAVEQLIAARRTQRNGNVWSLHIRQKEQRTLETRDDWIQCAREILTALFWQIHGREQVHLFISVPMALAFMLGMGIEHFSKVTAYAWSPNVAQYFPVLHLDKLGRTSKAI